MSTTDVEKDAAAASAMEPQVHAPDANTITDPGPPQAVTTLPAKDKIISSKPNANATRRHAEPTDRFTGHQLFYVFVLDGLGGMALSAGVNFALAYAMYTTQDTVKNPIRLFQLPNTLAGDAAVTIFVQCILTWFVELGLVTFDLRQRSVQPIGFIPEPKRPLFRWLYMLPPSSADMPEGTEAQELSGFTRFVQNLLRGFFLAVAGFIVLWPIGVGALTALGERSGGDYLYSDRWTPQAFKAILGGLLGLFTTPPMAMFWLVKAGWESSPVSEAEDGIA